MTAKIRDTAETCLGRRGRLSLRRHVMGVYADDNPRDRSVLAQVRRIRGQRFVRLGIVTIDGAAPNLQRNLDNANDVFQAEANVWVYPTGSVTEEAPDLLVLDQDDCRGGSRHSVSDEEDALFDLGRNLGAAIVCYYIQNDGGGSFGCAAHPPGRRGFWCGDNATPWTFAHELGHIVGSLDHVTDTDRLMTGGGTDSITNAPPDLSNGEARAVRGDDAIERCEVPDVA